MRGLLPAIYALTFLFVGCDSDPRPQATGRSGGEAAKKPPVARERGPELRPSGEPRRVTFVTRDGVTIGATLRPGGDQTAPAVILVHQLASTREEWAPVIAKLAEAPGLTILALDMRGHGESTAGPEGATLAHRDFRRDDWTATSNDVLAAVEYLKGQEMIQPRAIAAIGSSIGSTAVIAAAAEEPRITAVVAISPGRAYHGFDAYTPLTRIGERPFLAIASENEAPAVETATAMERIAPSGELQLYPGEAHGVSILQGSPEMADRLDTFVRGALGPAASRPPPPAR
jgi:pimeloyl-ACP methyl ester carboxylesterase